MGTAFNYMAYRVIFENAGKPLSHFRPPFLLETGIQMACSRVRDWNIFEPFFGDYKELARRTWVYAHCEIIGRTSKFELASYVESPLPEKWESELVAMALLMKTTWPDKDDFVVINPTLGTYLMRGDADLVQGDTLVDFKTSAHLGPDTRDIRQLICYGWLAKKNKYLRDVKKLRLYQARYGVWFDFTIPDSKEHRNRFYKAAGI